mmetsp:Transcript_53846/g.89374  ORF Transcript_53846/g.89374 Transcript_53846/m.89374 type:complete len:136 (-) Transcript_53846:145-552(-)
MTLTPPPRLSSPRHSAFGCSTTTGPTISRQSSLSSITNSNQGPTRFSFLLNRELVSKHRVFSLIYALSDIIKPADSMTGGSQFLGECEVQWPTASAQLAECAAVVAYEPYDGTTYVLIMQSITAPREHSNRACEH